MTSADTRARPKAPLRRALRDEIYDLVLERLLDGSLAPGQPLSIDVLARDLQVSPTPVREAMVQLEHTGLVVRAALKGYRVAPPLPATRLSELFEARELLEVAAVRRAVPLEEEVLANLRDAQTAHHVAADRVIQSSNGADWDSMRHYYAADWAFHLIVLQNCGNSYFLELAESLSPSTHRLRQSLKGGPTDVRQAVEEHATILQAIETGDPDAAAEAMREHIQAVRERSFAELD